jgi:hypothetical protein
MIPNLLAEVVVVNFYMERIERYIADGNRPGEAYIYSMIFRKVFLYNMPPPDTELDTLIEESNRRAIENGIRVV